MTGDDGPTPLMEPPRHAIPLVDYETRLSIIPRLMQWVENYDFELGWCMRDWEWLNNNLTHELVTGENLTDAKHREWLYERLIWRPLFNATGWKPVNDVDQYPNHPYPVEEHRIYWGIMARENITHALLRERHQTTGMVLTEMTHHIKAMEDAYEPIWTLFVRPWQGFVKRGEKPRFPTDDEIGRMVLRHPDHFIIAYPDNNIQYHDWKTDDLIEATITMQHIVHPSPAVRVNRTLDKLGWKTDLTQIILQEDFEKVRKWIQVHGSPFDETGMAFNPGKLTSAHCQSHSITLTALVRIELAYRLMHQCLRVGYCLDMGDNDVFTEIFPNTTPSTLPPPGTPFCFPSVEQLLGGVRRATQGKVAALRQVRINSYFVWAVEALLQQYDSLPHMATRENRQQLWLKLQQIPSNSVAVYSHVTNAFLRSIVKEEFEDSYNLLLVESLGADRAQTALALLDHEYGPRSFEEAITCFDHYICACLDPTVKKTVRRWRIAIPPELQKTIVYPLKLLVSTHDALMQWSTTASDEEWHQSIEGNDFPNVCRYDIHFPWPNRVFGQASLPDQTAALLNINFFGKPIMEEKSLALIPALFIKEVHDAICLKTFIRNKSKRILPIHLEQFKAFRAWIKACRCVTRCGRYAHSQNIISYEQQLVALNQRDMDTEDVVAKWITRYPESYRHVIQDNILMQFGRLPSLENAFATYWPLYHQWKFARQLAISDAMRILATPLQSQPTLRPELNILFDGVNLHPTRRKPSAKAKPKLSSRVRVATIMTDVPVVNKALEEAKKIIDDILAFVFKNPMDNLDQMAEHYLWVHAKSETWSYRRPRHQVKFAAVIDEVFRDVKKRGQDFEDTLREGEVTDKPLEMAKLFVPKEIANKLIQITGDQPQNVQFDVYALMQLGIPHADCTFMKRMESNYCERHESVIKMYNELFTKEPFVKYTIYLYYNRILEVRSIEVTRIPDPMVGQQQIATMARAANRTPIEITENYGRFVASTQSGRLRCGVKYTIGGGCNYDPITDHYWDAKPALLKRRLHYTPAPLFHTTMIGQVIRMPRGPFKTMVVHRRVKVQRWMVGGRAAKDHLAKYVHRKATEEAYFRALDRAIEAAETGEPQTFPEVLPLDEESPSIDTQQRVKQLKKAARKAAALRKPERPPPCFGIVGPAHPLPLPAKDLINEKYKEELAIKQKELDENFAKLGETYPIDAPPCLRTKATTTIPSNFSVRGHFLKWGINSPAFKFIKRELKKYGSLVLCTCCQNSAIYHDWLFGPWPNMWCRKWAVECTFYFVVKWLLIEFCQQKKYIERCLPTCACCNRKIVRYHWPYCAVLYYLDMEYDGWRCIRLCIDCTKINRVWTLLDEKIPIDLWRAVRYGRSPAPFVGWAQLSHADTTKLTICASKSLFNLQKRKQTRFSSKLIR